MANKRFDQDFDNEKDGYVGGEKAPGGWAGEDGAEYNFGPCREIGYELGGKEYSYLGHFRQPKYACEGHNDMAITEPGLPPLDVPSAGAGIPQQQQRGGAGPIGSAVNKAIEGLIGGLL